MKVLLLVALSLLVWVDPATVRKINAAKSAAEEAFKRGDYAAAVGHYRFLVDSLGVTEDEVVINLANSLYLAKDTAHAVSRYQAVTQSPKHDIRSKAHQQLGIMANQQGRAEEALNHFKQAIKAEPANDDARYNYEMLKKKLEEKNKQEEEQQQKNKDQEKQDQENQDQQNEEQKDQDQQQEEQQKKDEEQQQKDQEKEDQQQQQEQEEKDEQEQQDSKDEEMPNLDRERLDQMKISEEKARMILEAMKNQEKQYLQQQKRKPTQSRDRNKPDW